MLLIETRVLGRRGRPLDRWSIPLPPEVGGRGDGEITLRDLITRVVVSEVDAYEERRKARRLVHLLSADEIEASAARGKVDSGGRGPVGPAEAEAAVGAALAGFEDGLYLVVLDGVEQKDLDAPVLVSETSQMVFLRLTFLAGA